MSDDSFHALFKRHWDAGTGLPKDKRRAFNCWTSGDFINALSRLNGSADTATVERWVKGETVTNRRPTMLAILAVFFGKPCADTTPHPDRDKMEAAWTAQQSPAARRPARAISEEPEQPRASDWPRQNPPPSPGPAALELFTPLPDNQGGYRLRARLDMTAREDESQPDQPIRIALREAFVTLEVSENLVTDGSLIGKREEHENLVPDGGAVKVVGPKAADGSLQGEVFADRHIATVWPTADAAATATLRVVAGRRGFVVTALDENGAPAEGPGKEARDAVLDLLFFEKLPHDEAGRAVLQKAVLTRPAKA